VAAAGRNRDSRVARDRARLYQARQEFQQSRIRRRRRDNLIAGVAGGVLILAVIGGQVAYYTVGDGAPAPEPSATPSPSAPPTPTPLPTP
jgi:hypothetical protein